MTYSTGFTAIAGDPYGEPLAARVYARRVEPLNFTNYYDPSMGRMRPTNSTGAWSFREDTTYSTPVAGQPVYRFSATGGTSYIEYKVNQGELGAADKIMFSVYVHSGSCHQHYLNVYAGIDIDTYHSGAYQGSDYINLTPFGSTFQIAAVNGSRYQDYGVEYIANGWSRVWLSILHDDGEWRNYRSFNFKMRADGSSGGSVNPYTYMSAPMIEADVSTPSQFVYKSGIFNHPTDLFELASYEKTINMNPLLRKRERDYGVVQGQKIQLQLSNAELSAMTPSIANGWVAVQFGFPSYNLWETVYQGRVVAAAAKSDLTLDMELDEAVMSLLEAKTTKDMYFSSEPWASGLKSTSKDANSKAYNNTSGGVTFNTSLSGYVRDELYTVVFDDASHYRIQNEYGAYLQDNTKTFVQSGSVFTTSSNAEFCPAHYVVTGANVMTLSKSGWSGTYSSGDTFSFATSHARTAQQLTPLGMVKHLVEDVAGIVVYDVMSGTYYASPFVQPEFFDNNSGTSQGYICGEWKAGSRIVEMVQDALKLEHMSIFPTETGRIGIWSLGDIQTGTTALVNGDPSTVSVNLINGSVTDTLEDYANIVVVNYLDVDTGEEVSTKVEYPEKIAAPVQMEISVKWRAEDNTALTCASRALYRFSRTKRVYDLNTTLELADVDITKPIAVTDTFLSASNDKVVVVERALDVTNQQIQLVAWNDPLASLSIAKVGYTAVGSTEETTW
jgi:hypothetical protein